MPVPPAPTSPVYRVLILGDNNVGKTTIVNSMVSAPHGPSSGTRSPHGRSSLTPTTPTVGPLLSVSLAPSGSAFIEYVEIGGDSYGRARLALLGEIAGTGGGVDGVMFVSDATNDKSARNLRKWMRQLLFALGGQTSEVTVTSGKVKNTPAISSLKVEGVQGRSSIPIMLVSAKADLAAQADGGTSLGFSLPGFGSKNVEHTTSQVLESAEAGEHLHFGTAGQLLVTAVSGGGRSGGGLFLRSAEARAHFRAFLQQVETEAQAVAALAASQSAGQASDSGFVTMSLSDVRGRTTSPPSNLFSSPNSGASLSLSPTLPHRERAGSASGIGNPLFGRPRADSTSKKWA